MKWLFALVVFVLFFPGCAGSPLKTGAKAEENKYKMSFIYKGMTEQQFQTVMGKPYKKEIRYIEKEVFNVWFYITKRVGLSQSKLLSRNFTPFIFQNGILLGWGYNFYNHLLDIQGAREESASEMRQRYTDDEDEWPREDHQWIEPQQDPQEPLLLEEDSKAVETETIPEKKIRPGKQKRESK